jgi:hypothetical protein
MFDDQVMKKKPKSTEFASAVNEINRVDRDILMLLCILSIRGPPQELDY